MSKDEGCVGLRFRASSNFYLSDDRFEERRGFRLLKRQSCTGCAECGCTYEFIRECAQNYDDLPIEGNKPIDTFKDYSIRITDGEEGEFEFYPIGDNKF